MVPPKRRCTFNPLFTGCMHARLRLKMQVSNPFGNGQGKEICVALGNLVIIGMKNAERLVHLHSCTTNLTLLASLHSLLGTSKGRMTVTEPVMWADEEMGMFIVSLCRGTLGIFPYFHYPLQSTCLFYARLTLSHN